MTQHKCLSAEIVKLLNHDNRKLLHILLEIAKETTKLFQFDHLLIQPMFRLVYSKGFINVASCRREIQFYLPASSTAVGRQYRSGEQDVQASFEIHCQMAY